MKTSIPSDGKKNNGKNKIVKNKNLNNKNGVTYKWNIGSEVMITKTKPVTISETFRKKYQFRTNSISVNRVGRVHGIQPNEKGVCYLVKMNFNFQDLFLLVKEKHLTEPENVGTRWIR